MKRIIAIFMVLIILFVLIGCTSTNVKPSDYQEKEPRTQDSNSQQKQQITEVDEIPQPPPLPD